jgi:hypothetical protein
LTRSSSCNATVRPGPRLPAPVSRYPAISQAAALGTGTSVLIRQFGQLERDTGNQLYVRQAPGTPMQPTRHGTHLLSVLHRSDVADLVSKHAKAPRSPRQPRPPRYGPRKPTPAERTSAFYTTLAIQRIVITPQVCTALRVLTDAATTDPEGVDITEICARSQLTRYTIYPILSRVTSARWVSRRPETPQSRRSRAGPGKAAHRT